MSESREHSRLAWLLSGLGMIPFVGCATLIWLGPAGHVGAATQALVTYAAVVLSFLGGIQWGLGVAIGDQSPKSAQSLFLLSVVPAVMAWSMLFISTANARIIVAIFVFGFVWVFDALLHLQKLMPAWFLRMRTAYTAAVMVSLIAALLRF